MKKRYPLVIASVILAGAVSSGLPADAEGGHPKPTSWGPAVPVAEVNSTVADGCPIESPDGKSLYIASTRPGGLGGNDIWVAQRRSKRDAWSPPTVLAAPINSPSNDFCPTPLSDRSLLFVSDRPGEGTCNVGPMVGDIYMGWSTRHTATVKHLGCVANGTGPNLDGAEFSPSLVVTWYGIWLYFSSNANDGAGQDLYVSRLQLNGTFAAPTKVTELNTAGADQMPNVSADGLKMVFVSDRAGPAGALDVYMSTRRKVTDAWSAPVNLGPNVNSTLPESRPSLSADGQRLYFGRAGDIMVSTLTRGL